MDWSGHELWHQTALMGTWPTARADLGHILVLCFSSVSSRCLWRCLCDLASGLTAHASACTIIVQYSRQTLLQQNKMRRGVGSNPVSCWLACLLQCIARGVLKHTTLLQVNSKSVTSRQRNQSL